MEEHFSKRLIDRFRPAHGWLPFLLLSGALACLAFSVLEAGWVAEDDFLPVLMAAGFSSAAVLAQRPIRHNVAWGILIIAGLALSFIIVAELWPPSAILGRGEAVVLDYWRIRFALFVDRSAGWLTAVRSGGRSTETVVFALGLAVAAWFVAALTAWSAYRTRRPFLGLTLAGFALATNTFYGQTGLYWAVFFFGLAITAGTYLSHLYREIEWDRSEVDYSSEIRSDLIIYTAGISLGLMSLAMAIPAINFRAIADGFQRQEAVVAAEQTMARAFAGVAQPRTDEGSTGGGGMPRSFLLGGGPELAETVVMTATLRAEPAAGLAAYHWRSISFDVYTGRGWQRSPEREENFATGQTIPPPDEPILGQPVAVSQDVDWTYDRRATRYTLGRPVKFSHDVAVMWRGQNDLVGVRGRNTAPSRYAAQTAIVVGSEDQLRAARLDDVPPEIRARYTNLPETVTSRVVDLTLEIIAPASGEPPLSPYDQARAIEEFLHQYPYSLDLPPVPPEVDIVDYFLFDLQTGFCDYYATAMVVMARIIGLPARLGVGFLQQPADRRGVQTIYQLNAHSWAEVYFAGYGWVEFEPTAPFASSGPPTPAPAATAGPPPTYSPDVVPITIPERAPHRETPWLLLLGLAAAVLVAARLWGRALAARFAPRDSTLDEVQLSFARLQESAAAFGRPPQPAQTPAEFAAGLLADPALEMADRASLQAGIERLAGLFAARQYGRATGSATAMEARATWEGLKRPVRRLIWRRRFGRAD